MSTTPIAIPQRRFLLQQVTQILRDSIRDGKWTGQLPGERELSKLLHVSRPTLREALEILARERMIDSQPGQQRKILISGRRRGASRKRIVFLLTPIPLYDMSRNRLFLFDRLYHDLVKHDIKLEILHHRGFGLRRPAQALKLMEERKGQGIFLLTRATEVVQREISSRSLPALILGRAHTGVPLPSIDCDFPALGRHAAGLLLSRGHLRTIVFLPESPTAGDRKVVEEFKQEFLRNPAHQASCEIVHYKDDPATFLAQWEKLQHDKPEITAVFSIYPLPCLLIQSFAQSNGMHPPALLSGNVAPFCSWAQPMLAHYRLPLNSYANRLCALVHELLQSGSLPLKHTAIMPDFIAGDSLYPDALDSEAFR
jgi:DNA-binding LacI/PurR family transcriptional regulator